jgi:hypothetical protein
VCVLQAMSQPASSEALDACMGRIQALQAEHAGLARTVQTHLAKLQQATPGDDLHQQIEQLCSQLAGGRDEAAGWQAEQSAATERLGQQVITLAGRLDDIEGATAVHGPTAEALRGLQEKLQEVAAAQEQQTAQLMAVQQQHEQQENQKEQAPGSRAGGAAQGEEGSSKQLAALQQSLDEMAQLVFDLRVEVLNNNEDTTITLASTRRQVRSIPNSELSLSGCVMGPWSC